MIANFHLVFFLSTKLYISLPNPMLNSSTLTLNSRANKKCPNSWINTINEMITFVAKKQSYEADDGHTDDLVMCLVLFAWLTRQDYFKNITDIDVRTDIYEEKILELEDEMTPFGFISSDETEVDGIWDGDDRWFEDDKLKHTKNPNEWL